MLAEFKQTLLTGWNANGDYAQRLVADLKEDQWTHQPGPGMNHPAWVLAHLTAYLDVLEQLLTGGTPADPKDHPFGMQSKPESDLGIYGTPEALVAAYVKGHEAVAGALENADEAAIQRAMPIERWTGRFPKVGDLLGYVMLVHEATHLGQLSAWRRVQGLPSV
ncbi:DinB superfamily protein [Mucisphaera calidilacus]|uniref:DinB superfamily protein n=2 Tax=Mucisphaera calidilacus TaxID=2527982 RepID=A0A518BXQ3_9BACT|nr:DinB superfamily protein [Mucisphaera calidilacus]